MTSSYQFLANELPDQVFEPLKTLSVIHTDPSLSSDLSAASENAFYYKCIANDVFGIFKAIEQSKATFFSVALVDGDNKLTWNSQEADIFSISLSQHAYSHNAYVGRYLKFTKQIAPKGSPQYGTRFEALAKREGAKYSKDVHAMIEAVFPGSEVCVLTDRPLNDFETESVTFQEVRTSVKTVEISAHTDLSPLASSTVSDEESYKFLEYLSLLHLNAYPDLSNSHVAATNSYEPELSSGDKMKNEIYYLTYLSAANPLILSSMLQNTKCLSVQGTTETKSITSLYTTENLYTWEVSKSKKDSTH
ncbi:hypothetical protein PUMCH_003306 [Australozyma saopauloensis]|uniref:Uncharacterized protein n=1 Tax=Australozyma saopauloensis TaxID=291208 RepID=A0AAX4HBM7_9ASCO|nr:hypothetical protein PUMCH_003306 [[Candida] saopauloensis]